MKKHSPAKKRVLNMRAAALSVVRRLHAAGHVAFFAGGCVRDRLMGMQPHDYDVATSATPSEVMASFRRTQKVGAKFGVVLVRVGRFAIEVATFRTDGDYQDGRHPVHIRFTNAREDAYRRDFTINGMFYDPLKRQVVDYVGGQEDLETGVVRAIGEPQRRFEEDHLRILRAIRFAARFDFEIAPATWSAMRANAAAIQRISPERIREELAVILSHRSRARAFESLHASDVLQHLWPGAAALVPHQDRIRRLLSALPGKVHLEVSLAVLLHPIATKDVAAACDGLRCSNHTRQIVTWLVAHQDALMNPADVTLADLKLLMAHPAFKDLLTLFAAKLRALGRAPTPYRQVTIRVRSIPLEEVTPPPLVDGRYLEKLGLPKGPAYKAILDELYYAQLNGDFTMPAAARTRAARLVEEASRRSGRQAGHRR
ncbi:MAG: CCA tRNA nucleotidyltransferase [Phycisphaerae bacterium]|nr:CCA tRNA nucleotidyltransferase [Phycisphaerae bacterium]